MLEASVYELAKASSSIAKNGAIQELMNEIGAAQQAFADRNIRGGPAVFTLQNLVAEYWVARYKTVANELIRASRSEGLRYRPYLRADLTDALDKIIATDENDFKVFLSHHLRVHIEGNADAFAQGAVDIGRNNGRHAALVEFGHFVAELKTARTSVAGDRRFEFGKLLAAAVAGAAATWLIEHGDTVAAKVWGMVSHHP